MSATDVTQTQVGIVGAGPAGCDGYHGVCLPAVPDGDGDGFMAERGGVKRVGEGQIV